MKRVTTIAVASLFLSTAASFGQQAKPAAPAPTAAQQQAAAGVTPPSDYVIGAGDILIVTYWEDPAMTTDAVVRPDGMITLPLLNDVPAMGLRPEQLRDRLKERSTMFEDPRITVGVRTITSRKVYIVGGVGKQGAYDILGPMDILELLTLAGGPNEFADKAKIRILRDEGGKRQSILFNYNDVLQGKNLDKVIQLKPGDRVTVPED